MSIHIFFYHYKLRKWQLSVVMDREKGSGDWVEVGKVGDNGDIYKCQQ